MERRPIWSTTVIALLLVTAGASGQQGVTDGEWRHYGGDLGSTKYSTLDQVDAGNVSHLRVAWSWDSPDNALVAAERGAAPAAFKATPIMVDGVLYVRTSMSIVVAIDPTTGTELWRFDPRAYEAGRPVNLGFNSRGVAYWEAGADRRIYLATADSKLWALDAETGRPDLGFGVEGRVDLLQGLRREVPRATYQVISPPLVIRDVVVVGSSIQDGPRYMTAPPGDVRAFDARTGEQRWIFHTVPLDGQLGSDTWEAGSNGYTGNTNVWTMMSGDEEAGLVYLPTGTPTNDWYGGHRLGDNLFAESVVAVEAETGRRVWHFQTTHHGVWDYDLPAAPTLLDIEVDGRPVQALAQVTKQGFLFVFDRITGEPVWPIEERPVPPSDVPGERLSPTQPFPTRPAPFDRQGLGLDDLIDFTPELRDEAEEILSEADFGPLYTPPSTRGTWNLPGWAGAGNWYGAAIDPESGMLYVPSRTAPMRVRLGEPDPSRSDFRCSRQRSGSAAGPRGLPITKPPYARLTAIDMNSGEHRWQVALGDGPRARLIGMGVPDPGPLGGGAFTGPLLTPTLLFIGHAGARGGGPAPPALLAIDKATGATIHAVELPGAPGGTPMTYELDGRQYVVVAYGRGGDAGMVALALDGPDPR